jgi:uncharacterized membrane protein YphA (DoxX/SURF4 family)
MHRWGIAIMRLLMGVMLIAAGLGRWFGGINGSSVCSASSGSQARRW